MTFYIRDGSLYTPTSEANIDIHPMLPAGNYTVKFNEMRKIFFLDRIDNFNPPSKVYGDTLKNSDRIISTFNSRDASTGVMLAGEKGSGKTLLARQLSIDLAKQGVPTIIINEAYCGDTFNQFIQSITQPAVILFDEFEKVYDKEDQEKILTLFDGVFPTKKLFILTCNDKYRVDSHMRNRPGRIYYMLDFIGLEKEFIVEYCEDNLINKDHINSITTISSLFGEFNFDMLKALVEEMNRYGECAADAIKMLNAKPSYDDVGSYETSMKDKDGNEVITQAGEYHGNPLKCSKVGTWTDYTDGKDDIYIVFNLDDLKKVDPVTQTMVFLNREGYEWTFKRKKMHSNFDFSAF